MSQIELIEGQPLRFTLDKDEGFLVQGDVPIGRLATIEFQDATRLAKHGDTLFVSRDAIAKDQSTSKLHRGEPADRHITLDQEALILVEGELEGLALDQLDLGHVLVEDLVLSFFRRVMGFVSGRIY